jgi:signal transduction histidine kinase
LRITPPSVRLWFADNGVGIPKEAQERIFKMFQRLDKSYDGTGVGLTVLRKAVEKMGGRVGLESEPGHGSRFWVELKAADQPE